MTVIQIIPGTGASWADPDMGAPVLAHPLQTHGSLYLYEPTRTGIVLPVDGARIGNVLAVAASTVVQADTSASWAVASPSLLEITHRGGIHARLAPDATAAGRGVALRMPAGIRAYIRAHVDHSYYFSYLGAVTHAATAVTASMLVASQTEVGIAAVTDGYTGTYDLGFNGPGPEPDAWNTVGVTHRQVATSTLPASIGTDPAAQLDAYAWMVSNRAFNQWADRPGASGGRVLYYAYAEDLTVSGRTYAEVAALDRAYATAQALTPGGRYHQDTWTTN